MPLIPKLRTFFKLSNEEKRIVLSAFTLFPRIAFSLKYKGWQKTLQSFELKQISQGSSLSIQQVKQTVGRGLQFYRPLKNCLNESFTLYLILKRMGFEVQLQVGVKKDSNDFSAHAWVEHEGHVLNDSENVRERFQTFPKALSD